MVITFPTSLLYTLQAGFTPLFMYTTSMPSFSTIEPLVILLPVSLVKFDCHYSVPSKQMKVAGEKAHST